MTRIHVGHLWIAWVFGWGAGMGTAAWIVPDDACHDEGALAVVATFKRCINARWTVDTSTVTYWPDGGTTYVAGNSR